MNISKFIYNSKSIEVFGLDIKNEKKVIRTIDQIFVNKNDKLFFRFNDKEWFNKFSIASESGIAIEIKDRALYECKSKKNNFKGFVTEIILFTKIHQKITEESGFFLR